MVARSGVMAFAGPSSTATIWDYMPRGQMVFVFERRDNFVGCQFGWLPLLDKQRRPVLELVKRIE